jgi:predicted small secreted protein
MKNTRVLRIAGIIALLAVTGFSMAACGGNDPKSLAKQAYDLTKQALTVGTDLQKAADLAQKSLELTKKVEQLSGEDEEIYAAEYARLTLSGGR